MMNSPEAVAGRLREHVLTHTSRDATVLTCEFEPGGKLNGVGIPSPLYCKRCDRAQVLHDIGISIAALLREVRPLLQERD